MSRLAVVTGGSAGIGAATARRLDRDGWRLVVIARGAERLERVCGELSDATALALDLTDPQAPARVAEAVGDRLDLLVNNAGGSRRALFGDPERGGAANLAWHIELNLLAVARLTEALLPALRAAAPSAVVNVSSIAGRVALAGQGSYASSKFALCGWTEALSHEERPNGVHVGLVLPGFIRTEGFPAAELPDRAVSTPEVAAEAIVEAGLGRKPERYVPRPYFLAALLRIAAPRLTRRVLGGKGANRLVTKTGASDS